MHINNAKTFLKKHLDEKVACAVTIFDFAHSTLKNSIVKDNKPVSIVINNGQNKILKPHQINAVCCTWIYIIFTCTQYSTIKKKCQACGRGCSSQSRKNSSTNAQRAFKARPLSSPWFWAAYFYLWILKQSERLQILLGQKKKQLNSQKKGRQSNWKKSKGRRRRRRSYFHHRYWRRSKVTTRFHFSAKFCIFWEWKQQSRRGIEWD